MMSLNDVPKRILDVPIWTAGHKDFELVRTLRIFITSKTLQALDGSLLFCCLALIQSVQDKNYSPTFWILSNIANNLSHHFGIFVCFVLVFKVHWKCISHGFSATTGFQDLMQQGSHCMGRTPSLG